MSIHSPRRHYKRSPAKTLASVSFFVLERPPEDICNPCLPPSFVSTAGAMEAIDEIYAAAGLGAADLDLEVPNLPVGGANLLPVGGANLLPVGGAILLDGHNPGNNLPLGNLPNPDEEPGWTKAMNKKSKNFKAVTHKKSDPIQSPVPVILDPVSDDLEVIWYAKSSSRRATMKWALARLGTVVGTSEGNGFFIYGSMGENCIEY